MQPQQIFFLCLALALLALGMVKLFLTEKYYYWGESRKYAYPLEPSAFKLRSMRLGGVLEVVVGLALAYFGIAGQ